MKKKVLVINDSRSLSEIIQFYLEMKNYDVAIAPDGYQGVEKAKEFLPDIILLDVIMPGIDGFEVCRRLKQEPITQEVPILFLSSLTNSEDKIKGLEIGAVDFISNTADQPELLARIGTHLKIRELTQKLKNSNQELRTKQKALSDDLYAAAHIQKSLLPPDLIHLPNHIKIAWFCQSSELVGGDICCFLPLNDENLIAYILDVSGHGVPSAMVTVSVTQYLNQLLMMNQNITPKEALAKLNKEYPYEKFNMFSTIFYLKMNMKTGHLLYCNAGHPPGIILSKDHEYKLLDSTGPMIGIDQSSSFEEMEEKIMPGEKIILFTDGITEYRNEIGEFYQSERLYSLLEKFKNEPIQTIIQSVIQSVKEFGKGYPPRDDISIMGIEFKTHLTHQEEHLG